MTTLRIKNMVCDRCKRVVREDLERLGIAVERVVLGEADIAELPSTISVEAIRLALEESGFALLDDHRQMLIEQLKLVLRNEIQPTAERRAGETMSAFLERKMGYDYTYLSGLFSGLEGQTIEHYLIGLRIEKAKEWLRDDETTVSEVAFRLGYSSSQHFSNQFRQTTGQTPGQFRQSQRVSRRTPRYGVNSEPKILHK